VEIEMMMAMDMQRQMQTDKERILEIETVAEIEIPTLSCHSALLPVLNAYVVCASSV